MLRSLTVVFVAAIVGCTSAQPSPTAASTSRVVASPTSSASGRPPTQPAQTPTQLAAVSCEMPFVASDQRLYQTGSGTAGFLRLPEGTFRFDPSGVLTESSSAQYSIGSAPVLPGGFFTGYRSWDAPAGRWLPVPPQQVAAGGASYVYQVGPEVHLVTVGSGNDTVIFRQPSGFPPANWAGPQLLAYVDGAVYLSVNSTYKGQGGSLQSVPADQVGVWRVDVAGGSPVRVLTSAAAGIVTPDGNTLWAVQGDSATPSTGTLIRYDLRSQPKVSWFTVPGSGMDLLGLDSGGNPLVWTFDYQGNLKIWHVSGPSTADVIHSEAYTGYVPFYSGNNNEFGPLATDSHGVWLGSTAGLFLYDGAGLHKVADAEGIPVGPCA